MKQVQGLSGGYLKARPVGVAVPATGSSGTGKCAAGAKALADYKQTLGRRASVDGNRMKDFESSREPLSAKNEKEV